RRLEARVRLRQFAEHARVEVSLQGSVCGDVEQQVAGADRGKVAEKGPFGGGEQRVAHAARPSATTWRIICAANGSRAAAPRPSSPSVVMPGSRASACAAR